MCPGISVLAGGGDGGGGNGKGAKGGKGKKKGKTDKKKNAAKSGKKGAKKGKKCSSSGKGGKCAKHNKKGSAGHPVDVATGVVYTEAAIDLSLPGLLPLQIERQYSTGSHDRDIGLGFGWSHSLAWTIEEHRRSLTITSGDGTEYIFDKPRIGETILGEDGWRLARVEWGYVLEADEDDVLRLFSARRVKTRLFLMTALEDQNGNRISLTYDDATGGLLEITDSAGRAVRFEHEKGHIARLAVRNAPSGSGGQWDTFARYQYDADWNLVRVTDAEGGSVEYAYDAHHHLTEELRQDGLCFHFLYDQQRRCYETWGDYRGRTILSLAADVPSVLADGTPAKGILHCRLTFLPDMTEVANSRRLIRYMLSDFGTVATVVDGAAVVSRTFDDRGNLLSETDPLGQTTTMERDDDGNVIRSTDEAGNTTKFERDANGRILSVTDAAGYVTRTHRDNRGRVTILELPNGGINSFEYDSRGLITSEIEPNGGRWQYTHDAHGNRVTVVAPNGGVWHFTYDYYGRLQKRVSPNGSVHMWVYSRTGRVVAEHLASGATKQFEYDAAGNLTSAHTPSGTWRLTWGGFDSMIGVQAPDGSQRLTWMTRARAQTKRTARRVSSHTPNKRSPPRPPRTRAPSRRTSS